MRSRLIRIFPTIFFWGVSCTVIATPTVTFKGEISSQTCSVVINGESNSVVLLPTVSMTDFDSSPAAGLTPFSISVSGCSAPKSDQNITTQFHGYYVDSDTGTLGNIDTTPGGAKGFGIQLLSDSTGDANTQINLNGITDVSGIVLHTGKTSATHEFGVQYYSLSTEGIPGKITAIAEYTVSYF